MSDLIDRQAAIATAIKAAVGATTIIWIMVKDLVDDIRETVGKE